MTGRYYAISLSLIVWIKICKADVLFVDMGFHLFSFNDAS